nr:uncharacterized protein LOC113821927 [Penaeus vannamei]
MHITTKATGYAVSTFHPEIILMETQILDFSMLAQTKTLANCVSQCQLCHQMIQQKNLTLKYFMKKFESEVATLRYKNGLTLREARQEAREKVSPILPTLVAATTLEIAGGTSKFLGRLGQSETR